jgi:hypothetical protein
MRGKVDKTYTNFKEGDTNHNKNAFNSMLEMFDDFTDKFTRWSKFSFLHQIYLIYLLESLTKTEHTCKYTYEQVLSINYALQEFINKMESAPLPL